MLDVAQLNDIASILPPEKLRDFVSMYLDYIEGQLVGIAAFAVAGDLDGLCHEAHKVVGTAGNAGAKRVSELARRIERASKNGDAETAARLVGELEGAATTASLALRAWLAEHGGVTEAA